ncbi:MAG: hypothetical protein WA173_01890 [Pseudomonas sp.]|uniref:hypothetical protein n=1 Tax=Pseudomonas sp. TaxID=306 RepID=UPI00271DA2F9|nr:hypothetical protein [Pseudomonas sp.]
MQIKNIAISALILSTLAFAGCDKKETAPVAAPAATEAPAAAPAAPAAEVAPAPAATEAAPAK